MPTRKLSGPERAAVVLLSLGEQGAAEVLRNMNQSDILLVTKAMARLGRVDQQTVSEAVTEFNRQLRASKPETGILQGTPDTVQRILSAAFPGHHHGPGIMLTSDYASPALRELLTTVEPRSLHRIIAHEHPQTQALILAHLGPKQCADLLRLLPPACHTDLILRISRMESVKPEMIDQITSSLKTSLTQARNTPASQGGAARVAQLLNALDRDLSSSFLDNLEQRSPDLAAEVKAMMFTFADLARLDTRGIAELVRRIPQQQLRTALKGAEPSLRRHILAAMSPRAATLLEEDLAAMPRIRLSEAESAQREIARVARQLVDEKVIGLSDPREQYV